MKVHSIDELEDYDIDWTKGTLKVIENSNGRVVLMECENVKGDITSILVLKVVMK